jgi:hypothetical protein
MMPSLIWAVQLPYILETESQFQHLEQGHTDATWID